MSADKEILWREIQILQNELARALRSDDESLRSQSESISQEINTLLNEVNK